MSPQRTIDEHDGQRLHDRLLEATGDRTLRRIGEMTNTHPETVRRYLNGHAPSVDFVSRLAHALGLNLNWILTGRGPKRMAEVKPQALRDANATDLLTSVALAIERLEMKVERLDRYTQVLEIMIRERHQASADVELKTGGGAREQSATPDSAPEPPGQRGADRPAEAGDAAERAARVADALSERPRPDAR